MHFVCREIFKLIIHELRRKHCFYSRRIAKTAHPTSSAEAERLFSYFRQIYTCMALYHHDRRETRKPWGLAHHGFDISICEIYEVKTQGECAILRFYMIDEISQVLPHTHICLYVSVIRNA